LAAAGGDSPSRKAARGCNDSYQASRWRSQRRRINLFESAKMVGAINITDKNLHLHSFDPSKAVEIISDQILHHSSIPELTLPRHPHNIARPFDFRSIRLEETNVQYRSQ
jgi:hypothetical protein